MNRFAYRSLLAFAFAAGLVSCTIVPEPTPKDVYRLPPSTVDAADSQAIDTSLRIRTPATSGELASTRILVLRQGNRVNAYSASRWSAPAPILWRDHLREAFGNDGRIRRLSGDDKNVRTTWELNGVLRAFQSEYRNGEPRVVIEFDANLIDERTREIAATRKFRVRENLEGRQVPQVVNAFGRAADTTARQVIDWITHRLR